MTATRMDFSGGVNCSELNLTNKSYFELSKSDFEDLISIKASLAVLEGVGCCLTVGMIAFFKAYKMFVHRISLYLNVAALVASVTFALEIAPVEDVCGYVAVKPGNENFCKAAGFFAQYFVWVIVAFINWITLHLFAVKCTAI